MCGICGIAYSDNRRNVETERLLSMRDRLAHRGPDGQGSWQLGNVGIAHRRLSIIDIAGGHQPLSNETGDVWVTFNGEIYNYRELKDELIASGHRFRTRTDTEVLVHGYEEYGTGLFKRLNGIFAFAIYDRARRRLLLVRDQMGIKPLFYTLNDEGLFFGSEIKSVLAGSGQQPRANREALQEYLTFRYTAGAQTLFDGVMRLPPAHYMVWEEGRVAFSEYWRSGTSTHQCSIGEARDALDHHLSRAVNLQLMSDVPLGCFCSGGVDSGLVTGYAARSHQGPLDTFSVGFEQPDWDETPLARDTATRFATRHHVLTLRAAEFGSLLPTLIAFNDEPLSHPNSVPLYLLSRFARDHVTVVLTGEGADELFGGYPRYHLASLYGILHGVHARTPAAVARFLSVLPGHRSRKAAELFAMGPQEALVFNSAYVHPNLVSQLTGADARTALAHRFRTLADVIDDDPISTLCRYELRTYLGCALDRMDRMSMAHGLEGRVPFLDVDLVDWGAQLNATLKVSRAGNKRVVKRLAESFLSPRITRARKSGFGVPLASWLRGSQMQPLMKRLQDSDHPAYEHLDRRTVRQLVTSHTRGTQDHAEALWLLLNLFLWYEVHIAADGRDMDPSLDHHAALIAPGGLNHLVRSTAHS